ncbi:hypothetical protein Tco_1547550 [Tanacetum coccineum]
MLDQKCLHKEKIGQKEIIKEKVDAKGVYQVSTVKPDEGTDKLKVSTDKPEVSNAKPKEVEVSTNKLDEVFGIYSQNKAKQKGVEIKDAEDSDRPRATSTRSVLTLKHLPKIDPKDKGKKVLEEEAESDVELEGVDEAERKFDQLTKDEEIARKVEESKEVPCSTKRYCNQKQTTTELQLKNQNDDLSEACRRKEAC